MPERQPDLNVHIIAPSAYDDKGTLKQYSRILMLAPVFAIIDGIVDKAASDSGLNISIVRHNERLERGDRYLKSIIGDSAHNSVTFITAKSFEVPRAIDIAKELQRAGRQVVLGGPGITSGDLKLYQYLINEGIPFNVGEGENTIPQIIKDVLDHRLQQVYWQNCLVDMRTAPKPRLPQKSEFKQMMTSFAAVDISEGCPFRCSFCSVRKIRGNNKLPSRCRIVEQVVSYISDAHDIALSTFVIDDNLRTAFTYPESKKALIDLNEEKKRKGRPLFLFGQADVGKDIIAEIPSFAAMGYKHLFFGMETTDKLVLAKSRKRQNNPEFYKAIADECRRNNIAVSTGRMVGFSTQTPESISQETKEFIEIVDIINNFFVTPLPGTDDYFEAVREGQITSWDLNKYDSYHSVRAYFENMSQEEAIGAYYRCFIESFPIKDIIERRFQSMDTKARGCLYSRFIAELGGRSLPVINRSLYGRPFHSMLDGIPHFPLPWGRVKRPADGFTGFVQDPDAPEFQSPESNKLEKARFLSKVAWSPQGSAIYN